MNKNVTYGPSHVYVAKGLHDALLGGGGPCSLLPSYFHNLLVAPLHFSILAPYLFFSLFHFHFSLLPDSF